jgi:hypothetical protein
MVHELHKAGYQRVRISPGMAPSGMYWRCNITFAANMEDDGYRIREFDDERGLVASYSSANGSNYFGWKDGNALNSRQMARRFIERFPIIAKEGAGRDWPYAGWLTDVLGRAEQGKHSDVLVLYADYPLATEELRLWQPPPPPK